MGLFLDTMDAAKLVNQLNVVKNEFRQHLEGEPYGMLQRTLHNALFPEGHRYRDTPIGRMEDLEKATLDDVKAFFRTWYTPSNATLCIAGDFDRTEAKALVDKAFGPLPSTPRPPMPKVSAPPLQAEQRVALEEKVARLPLVAMAWRTPPFLDDRDLDLDVLSLLLVEGKGSRLYRAWPCLSRPEFVAPGAAYGAPYRNARVARRVSPSVVTKLASTSTWTGPDAVAASPG